jgi:hypothetical protein
VPAEPVAQDPEPEEIVHDEPQAERGDGPPRAKRRSGAGGPRD